MTINEKIIMVAVVIAMLFVMIGATIGDYCAFKAKTKDMAPIGQIYVEEAYENLDELMYMIGELYEIENEAN